VIDHKKCVIALVFKLEYPLRLLCENSTIFMFVKRVETGVVCKFWEERLQYGTVLWSRLILKVTGTNEAGTVIELVDQLHLSRWSFFDSLILQLGGGSQNSLYICVAAKQYVSESKILPKKLRYRFVFPSFGASKLCDKFLQQEIKLCLCNLGLWSPASSDVFIWFFIGLPEGHNSTVCSSNECCPGCEEFLVVNGAICFYGYLKWKFRFPPGLSSMRNVRWVANNLLSVVCTRIQWDTAFWNSVVIQVLKDYHTETAKEWVSRRHENCVWSSHRVGTCIQTVEANTHLKLIIFTRWECSWLFIGIHYIGLHLLVGIFSTPMEVSKGSTLSSFLTYISGITFVMINLYEGVDLSYSSGWRNTLCRIQFRFVFDRGKFLLRHRWRLWYQPRWKFAIPSDAKLKRVMAGISTQMRCKPILQFVTR
ncbi:hypothetical protein MKW92_035615, partial [Papaver armeniacum]